MYCFLDISIQNFVLLNIVVSVHNRVSQRLLTLGSWFQFSLRTHDTYVKRVSQRSTESRRFSPGTPVSSHREC